jgi:hypothetical protein
VNATWHFISCSARNPGRFLLEHLRRLIVLFFAFRVLRHKEAIGDPARGCGDHRAILEPFEAVIWSSPNEKWWRCCDTSAEKPSAYYRNDKSHERKHPALGHD